MTDRAKQWIWVIANIVAIAVLMSISYSWGYDNGETSAKTTPVATQAQRIKDLESTVEKLVNNEQISSETAMKLDALDQEFDTHLEETLVASSTVETSTP